MSVSGLDISFLVNGGEAGPELRRITVAFERAGDEIADFSKHLFPKLAPIFEAEEARQFDAQGGGPGGAWAPLSPSYAAWKDRAFPGNPILVRSGALREALCSSSSPFAQRAISGDEFEYGTTGLEYASFHQLGTERMPARAEFDFSSDFERDINAAALAAVREAVQASGLAEFVDGASTAGDVTNPTVYTGSRGGRYTVSASGKKNYLGKSH